MKKKSIVGFVLLAALLVTGCSSAVETESGLETTEPLAITLPESNLVAMESVDLITISEEAQHELEARKNQEGSYLFTDNGKNYLAVFAGERNTGGYGVEIIEVVSLESELMVSVEMTEPGPDTMVTDALTYPMALVELKGVETIEGLRASVEVESTRESVSGPITITDVVEVLAIGQIMKFDGNRVHILSGDMVEVFEYDNQVEADFYLGQTVQLIKGESENILQPFIVEDFNIQHSSMGQLIYEVNGKIAKIGEETMTLSTDDGEMVFNVYEKPVAKVGDLVEVHYMNFDDTEENSVVALYRENSKMKMIVKEIHRTDNGKMMLYTSDIASEKIDYHVSIGGGTLAELNYSEIQVGDEITVYAEIILESEPAQVHARRVIK